MVYTMDLNLYWVVLIQKNKEQGDLKQMSSTRNNNYDDRKYLGIILFAAGLAAATAAAVVAWPGLKHVLTKFF